jgi:hypothetical protein
MTNISLEINNIFQGNAADPYIELFIWKNRKLVIMAALSLNVQSKEKNVIIYSFLFYLKYFVHFLTRFYCMEGFFLRFLVFK